MTRIAGVCSRDAGLYVRLAYHFTRRSLARLTGREPERIIEPLQMYAHVPGLLRGYARLEQATAKLHRVDKRLRALAELKAATLTHCASRIDMGSQISRRWGLSDEQLLAPSSYRASALFTDIDKLVLDYAVAMSSTPAEVSDALFAQMRGHFEHAQLVELTHLIALENMRGRFNLALGIGAAGFSAGMVCGPHSLPAIRTRKPRSRASRRGPQRGDGDRSVPGQVSWAARYLPRPPTTFSSWLVNSPVSIGIALPMASWTSGRCSDASWCPLVCQISKTQMVSSSVSQTPTT
jgi:alkylhydroperoxidase family enzyme